MRLVIGPTLCLFAVCGSSLVAQTFTFGKPNPVATTSYTGIAQVQTADINGYGRTDVVIPSASAQFDVYLGNGTGGFSTTPITANSWYLGATDPRPVFMDVNGDGIVDQVFGFGTFNDIQGGG